MEKQDIELEVQNFTKENFKIFFFNRFEKFELKYFFFIL